MSEDDDGYGDEFYDNDFQSQSFRERDARGDDDEQHTQKMNGKLEALQQKVEGLQQELEQERQSSMDIRKRYDSELALAWKENDRNESAGQLEAEKYKKKCAVLEEKLEMALLTSSSTVERVPTKLVEAIRELSINSKVLPDLQDKSTFSPEECLSILKASSDSKKKKKASSQQLENVAQQQQTESNQLRQLSSTTRLNEKIKLLEDELRVASHSADDAEHLKAKIAQASDRIRIEKEAKRAMEIDLIHAKKKVEMLSDHIEKLVVHVKREAAHKVRLSEQLRAAEKESSRNKEKSDLLQKKSAAKDRLVLELREGSKVLEDQLRLMDEKYLELRSKLDYARSIAAKKIRKAEKTASELRVKFAMTGSSVILDNISLPSGYGGNMTGTSGTGNGMFSSDAMPPEFAELFRSADSAMLPPKKGVSSRSIASNKSRNGNNNMSRSDNSMFSQASSHRPEPTLDGVLDKIRHQAGGRQDWTEEKAKALTKSR
jgi:hypothetical protein